MTPGWRPRGPAMTRITSMPYWYCAPAPSVAVAPVVPEAGPAPREAWCGVAGRTDADAIAARAPAVEVRARAGGGRRCIIAAPVDTARTSVERPGARVHDAGTANNAFDNAYSISGGANAFRAREGAGFGAAQSETLTAQTAAAATNGINCAWCPPEGEIRARRLITPANRCPLPRPNACPTRRHRFAARGRS